MSDPQAPTVPCPFCQEQIQPDARRCRHCGEDLVADAVAATPAGPSPEDAKLLKKYRQHKNSLGAVCVLVAVVNGWMGLAALSGPRSAAPDAMAAMAIGGGLALLATILAVGTFLHQYWAFAACGALFGLFLVVSVVGGLGQVSQTLGSARSGGAGCNVGCGWLILLLAVGEAGTVMGSYKQLQRRGLSPRGDRL